MMLLLGEWAIRSALLISAGGVLLWALRVKGAAVRLAAWTAMLCGSLAIPLLMPLLPPVALPVMASKTAPVEIRGAPEEPLTFGMAVDHGAPAPSPVEPGVWRVDWTLAAVGVYGAVAGFLLLRLLVALGMSLHFLRASRATGMPEIRESDQIASPVTLGIARPVIVLPVDWRDWSRANLDAVLAHERSHIGRWDPAVQFLSAIHRALLWFSPWSWFLHTRLVRDAEEASDDAAVASTGDRALYAEVLLEFMQRGVRGRLQGVPMARYGSPVTRVHRILDAPLARGVTRGSVAAILALGAPLAYLVAATHPARLAAIPEAIQVAVPEAQQAAEDPGYIKAMGTVSATTVTVKPRMDGQLMSVNFKEGDTVQAGQLLATIAPPPSQAGSPYTQILAPISGVTGMLKASPGNLVRASDAQGIVVINQLQPISVVFTIAEENIPVVMARMKKTPSLMVEAWNRDRTARIATGKLLAVDNQIDTETGTVKLKAEFENRDQALFPNQFVNVRLMMGAEQAAAKRVVFEVASVKPAVLPEGAVTTENGGILFRKGSPIPRNTEDPGRIHYPLISLKALLREAYDTYFEVDGPGWLDSQFVRIDATMPAGTTKEQLREMLRNLIADRFRLAFHTESKEIGGYALTVAKGGSKLKESVVTEAAAGQAEERPRQKGLDGFMIMPPRPGPYLILQTQNDNREKMFAQQQTMENLARSLASQLSTTVTDATGLTGKYDFTITFSGHLGRGGSIPPLDAAPDPSGLPDIFSALQSEAGLKLEKKKVTVEKLVVDRMEKIPVAN